MPSRAALADFASRAFSVGSAKIFPAVTFQAPMNSRVIPFADHVRTLAIFLFSVCFTRLHSSGSLWGVFGARVRDSTKWRRRFAALLQAWNKDPDLCLNRAGNADR